MGETKPRANNTRSALRLNSELANGSNFWFTLMHFRDLSFPLEPSNF